ncbi:unnamed protein product [Periconia digitata]|uniref:Uncharacterized protein n=1 Tax=Periconia digitata TaxID=1303443 RepID=A0A9W4UJ11_9PLEO|nr:unnamed protein product [Periconia digitata]
MTDYVRTKIYKPPSFSPSPFFFLYSAAVELTLITTINERYACCCLCAFCLMSTSSLCYAGFSSLQLLFNNNNDNDNEDSHHEK